MFRNEPLTDFTEARNREALQAALDALEDRIHGGGLRAFPIIDGREINGGREYQRFDPSESGVLVGVTHFAGSVETAQALKILTTGAAPWSATPFEKRCEVLKNAARIMRQKKHALSALIIREAGKPWREADGDVAEAIDFCDYYAEEMLRLGPPRPTSQVPGEESVYFYQPRGICAVISPWNFPLAIACGMATAALVTGNAVLLKPAAQTGLIAYEFSKILLEAGVPASAYVFLPGKGQEIGRELVNSPLVDMICFTGSKEVGLEILSKSSEVQAGQRNLKKVVAELGGKNAIIVDSDADMDEAIKGVIASAFGFSGQKCSACSRLIVVGDAYEPFIKRLCLAAADVPTGRAREPATILCPVIDKDSQERILRTISRAEQTNHLAFKGTALNGGHFVPAAIFRDVGPQSDIWREEIFGPVIAACRAKDFTEALELANNSQYALTGGVFSRSPEHLERARREFKVGNLYLNRGCTGAMVCRHPFGGFRMSGVGSKAGGPDYLTQFMEPRTVTENTLRRGFAPET